jgi:hypothetical protein
MPELITIHPDGKIDKKEITKIPELKDLKDIVKGWIELIPYFTTYEGIPCIAFCNEEGKLPHFDLPFNATATKLWAKSVIATTGQTRINDHLVGSIAVVVGPKSFLKDM